MRKRIAAAIAGAALIATGLTATPASAETLYEVIEMHNYLCWDVPNSNAYAGAQVQQWGCNGTTAQKWSWRQVDATHYEIRTALNPGLCLNNWEGGDTTGNHIKLYNCGATSPDRVFNFVRTGNGSQLQPKSAWKNCVSGWGGNDWGNELRLFTCTDVADQNVGRFG
ncbi:RICIN domain-containing protein [Kitasatospora purpeofusca]|uniref:RICIN domain-containing protein n=1 Tax=Kitasatospora purpeofusca TaxID=67352 RepID=A0ABZ1UAH5_9ACTN|nr:RICIN domain-containing protein [Kitasatospora purpeofusca]